MLKGKNILIGISAGIAAYKVYELIRMFKKQDADVKVIVTENALKFVSELTLATLSQNPVYCKQFEVDNWRPEHISLCDWADVLILAPATANTIGKITGGICDNLLSSIICAFKKPIIIAPAMNCEMWDNEFVQENVQKLKNKKNYYILDPEEGFLACGDNGKGRLVQIEKIFEKVNVILNISTPKDCKKVLITAGGTRENIDSVRFIGNYSSGKTGIALANEAYMRGFDVNLICTFDLPDNKPYKITKVNSALEMQNAIKQEQNGTTPPDIIIMSAAVADYRVKNPVENKIKKENQNNLTIELTKNHDILSELCSNKKSNQIIVGFCAETENLIENAISKITKKGCDFIVANDISRSDIGFSSDYNEVYVIDKNLNQTKLEKTTKDNIARDIFKIILG